MRKYIGSSSVLSVFFTLVIVTLLILSGPVTAVQVKVRTDKESYGGNDLVVFTGSVDIELNERLPVQNLTIVISNSSDVVRTCTFSPSGTLVGTCSNVVSVSVLNTVNYTNDTRQYAYGYGYSSGAWGLANQTFFDTSYGYGYGYSGGYASYSGELAYNITWNVSAESIGDGNYTVDLWAHASDGANSRIYSDATPDTADNEFSVDKTAPTVTAQTTPTSTVKSSSTTLTVTTNENAQCRYSTSAGISFSSMSSSTQTSLGTTHPLPLSDLSSGTYHYYIRCRDSNGNMKTADYHATVTVSISTGGGGGGGGIGISNVAGTASHTWFSIAAATPTSMSITSTNIALTEVEFELSSEASSPTLTVKSLNDKPSSVTIPPCDKVYQYVEIVASNLKDVAAVTLNFKVERSWLDEQGLSTAEVSLYRFVDGNWLELPTNLLTSDDKYFYFSAASPGFSYFAVGGKSAISLEPARKTELPPTVKVISEPPHGPSAPKQEPLRPTITVEEQRTLKWMLLFVIVISIALFVLSYDFFKRRMLPKLERQTRKYIARSRAMGKGDEEIRAALKTARWPDKKIETLLKKK